MYDNVQEGLQRPYVLRPRAVVGRDLISVELGVFLSECSTIC